MDTTEIPITDTDRLAHAQSKVTHWIASLDANAAHEAKRENYDKARNITARADDLRAVLDILNGTDDDYIRATGAWGRASSPVSLLKGADTDS